MAVHKFAGGRPLLRAQRFLIWVILGVVCLVLFQFWTYEQTWSSDPSNSAGSRKALRAMLMKSWFGLEDGHSSNRSSADSRAMRDILSVCNSSRDFEGIDQEKSIAVREECLMKLQENIPALQPLVSLSRDRQPATNSESCQDGVDEGQLQASQREIHTLKSFLKNSTTLLELKDTRESGLTDKDTTWFMSSIHGPLPAGEQQK
jgi:hypothetical protein